MKKYFLAIIIFLLMPVIVNANSFLCKYELDVESTNASNNSGYEYEDIANQYKNNFMDIRKIEVLKKEKKSTGGKTVAPVDISYYVGSSEIKSLFQDVIPKAEADYHLVNSHYIMTYYFGYDDFYSYINNYSKCPSDLKIYTMSWGRDNSAYDAVGYICINDECYTDESPVVYKLITQGDPIIDPSNPATKKCTDKNLNCQKIDAISCRKYSVRAQKYGSGQIELGNLDDGTRYYAVIFPEYPVGILYDTGTSYSVKVDTYTFHLDKSLWNSLVEDECTYKDVNLALQERDEQYTGRVAEIVIDPNNSGVVEPPEIEIQKLYFCEQARVLRAFSIAGMLLFILKILVPLIIIVLGTIDFAKAVISTGDKANKEAIMMLAKRFIIGVIIFLLPTILDLLLGLVDGAKPLVDGNGVSRNGFTACTHCLFNPFDDASCKK